MAKLTFLTSNFFLGSPPASTTPDFADLTPEVLDLGGAEGPASAISTSAMVERGRIVGFYVFAKVSVLVGQQRSFNVPPQQVQIW